MNTDCVCVSGTLWSLSTSAFTFLVAPSSLQRNHWQIYSCMQPNVVGLQVCSITEWTELWNSSTRRSHSCRTIGSFGRRIKPSSTREESSYICWDWVAKELHVDERLHQVCSISILQENRFACAEALCISAERRSESELSETLATHIQFRYAGLL